MNRQVEIKAEQIARMIVKGRAATRIAVEMGMSYGGLQRILATPEYRMIEDRVRHEVTGKMDARLAKRAEMADEAEDALPEAMRVLLEGVTVKRDLRAALELLDRDPRRQFVKASRNVSQIDPSNPQQIDSSVLDNAVKEAEHTHSILARAAEKTKPAEA